MFLVVKKVKTAGGDSSGFGSVRLSGKLKRFFGRLLAPSE